MKKPKLLSMLVTLHIVAVALAFLILFFKSEKKSVDSEKIFILPIEGVITMDQGGLNQGQTVSSILKTLKSLEDEKDVKAVVLRINSPGGSVAAVQEIHRALIKLKGEGKIVVSSFADVAASGGYYVACAGNAIVANPGTITGSIGVIMQLPNVQGLFQKVGLSMRTIKSGRMKDAGSPFREMNGEERAVFNELITDAYSQFFQAVKEGRNIDDKNLKLLADGRIFTGRLAKNHKLVDELGGLEEAIELAKKLSGLTDKEPKIIYHKGKMTLERLMNLVSQSPLRKMASFSEEGLKLMYLMQ